MDEVLQELTERALVSLGRLDSVSTLLPETSLFLYMYVRKEAVLSSQIEGTQSSLSDLLLYENNAAPGVPLDDVREVSNYVAAMGHGLKRLADGFPLSLRLIKEIHEILLHKGRGSGKEPGQFRRSQNWIGGDRPGNALFVPPPHHAVMDSMGSLEKFLHDEPIKTSPLMKAALAHVQFEAIHPFLDGNGRLGRLLITLILCDEKILSEPLLYLSLYIKQRRQQYYDLLQKVREDGDWQAWFKFFIEGVCLTAEGAVSTAKRIVDLFKEDRTLIGSIGKAAGSALQVHHVLQQNPVVSIGKVASQTGLSFPTVKASLDTLVTKGMVRELTGQDRGKLFGYSKYIDIVSQDIDT